MFINDQIPIKDLPDFKQPIFKAISKAYLKVIIFNDIILCAFLFGILLLLNNFIKTEALRSYFWIIYILFSIILITHFILIILGFAKRGYAIRDKDILYKRGLINHTVTIIPNVRIQHTDISRGFIARQFGFATLNIYTAGETGDDLSIKGLSYEEAEKLNSHLTTKINE